MDDVERFVISTGRAGSTLLSDMLNLDPNTLSLSEFLGATAPPTRFAARLSGEDFAQTLVGADEIGLLGFTRGFRLKDVHYEFEASANDLKAWGVKHQPSLLAMAIPTLSDTPVATLHEIVAFARKQPVRSAADHYRALWRWMAEVRGKKAWVERTGSNLRWLPEQARAFPNARYVNLHRDGPETALSMRNHNWFILAAELFERPPSDEDLEAAFRHPREGDADAFGRFFGKDLPPVEVFGRYWSFLIANGYQGYRHLRPDQILDVRFEDLENEPMRELTRIAEFFELPGDRSWIARAASLFSRERAATAGRRADILSPDERARLDEACKLGQILLGRRDPGPDWDTYTRIRAAYERDT